MSTGEDRVYDHVADVVGEAVSYGISADRFVRLVAAAWREELHRQIELTDRTFQKMFRSV